MTIKTLSRLLACSLALAATAEGGVKTFQPGSGSWNVGVNWDPDGVPTAADRVIIPTGKVCAIDDDDALADTVVIQGTGQLIIDAGFTLTLDNDNDNTAADPDNSEIDGTLFITGGGTPAALYIIDGHHLTGGDGQILGDDVAALVEIAANTILINQMDEVGGGFAGGMTIKGRTQSGQTNGTFRNEGRVTALDRNTIVLDTTTILDDIEGAWWGIGYTNSKLEFRREALTLEGDVETTGCTTTYMLIFKASIKTCGELIYNGRGIDLQNSSTFEYATFSGSEPNPGTASKFPTDCTAPWLCDEDDMGAGCP